MGFYAVASTSYKHITRTSLFFFDGGMGSLSNTNYRDMLFLIDFIYD